MDGDGIVIGVDVDQIFKFYGNIYFFMLKMIFFYDFGIYLEGDIFVSLGDLIELKINFGLESNLVIDVYGFIFFFKYNVVIFDFELVVINFDENSWMFYNLLIFYLLYNDK